MTKPPAIYDTTHESWKCIRWIHEYVGSACIFTSSDDQCVNPEHYYAAQPEILKALADAEATIASLRRENQAEVTRLTQAQDAQAALVAQWRTFAQEVERNPFSDSGCLKNCADELAATLPAIPIRATPRIDHAAPVRATL